MPSTIVGNILISLNHSVPRALVRWESQYRDHDGDIPVRGSGNYESDEAKEIARLKRELRDAQDALDV